MYVAVDWCEIGEVILMGIRQAVDGLPQERGRELYEALERGATAELDRRAHRPQDTASKGLRLPVERAPLDALRAFGRVCGRLDLQFAQRGFHESSHLFEALLLAASREIEHRKRAPALN